MWCSYFLELTSRVVLNFEVQAEKVEVLLNGGIELRVLVGPIELSTNFEARVTRELNPGIGGSEYHSIQLALILSEKFEVDLWVTHGKPRVAGLAVLQSPRKASDYFLQIAHSSAKDSESLAKVPLICVSHHPFDVHLKWLPRRAIGVAHVGNYQLKSNNWPQVSRSIPDFWLPVFLRSGVTSFDWRANRAQEFTVGHVSSLHPSKGFHDVLKAWMKFVSNGGEGTLEVLGGARLYGSAETHQLLPVSKSYGDKLLSIMGGEIHSSVKFLGLVPGDVHPVISRWHLAILNPLALGESESVAMKDCWRAGVPVIAGNYFGHRDYLCAFPELSIKFWRQIPRRIAKIARDESLRGDLSKRAISEFTRLSQRGNESEKQWIWLVTKVAKRESLEGVGAKVSNSKQAIAIATDWAMLLAHNVLARASRLFQ